MKRNKRTEVVAQMRLTPLTQQILDGMGPEGAVIRRRLQKFYLERALDQRNTCDQKSGRST